jgi:hypothetical protein
MVGIRIYWLTFVKFQLVGRALAVTAVAEAIPLEINIKKTSGNYAPPAVIINNSELYPQSVFIGFV